MVWAAFRVADASFLVDDLVERPVQVEGKVRGRVSVAPDADESAALAAATSDENVVAHIAGAELRKVIYVQGRMISIIV